MLTTEQHPLPVSWQQENDMTRSPHAPRRTKEFMVGCMLIDAINEASALRKYERARQALAKQQLRERAEREAWLNGESVSLALRRLTSAT